MLGIVHLTYPQKAHGRQIYGFSLRVLFLFFCFFFAFGFG